MRKTSKTARITILLLVLCLISTAMLSGTFARYTSEYAGADTALIAKWDVKFNGNEPTTSTAELDLFSHAYKTNINEIEGEDYIIAPGVSGDFTLKVENKGDVAAKMTFDFEAIGTAGTVPIEYSLDGSAWVNLATLETELNELGNMTNVAAGAAAPTTQKVLWRWPYEASNTVYAGSTNATDTTLGTDSAVLGEGSRTTYILKVTATATQIEPKTTP
jgi:hypothetical protein